MQWYEPLYALPVVGYVGYFVQDYIISEYKFRRANKRWENEPNIFDAQVVTFDDPSVDRPGNDWPISSGRPDPGTRNSDNSEQLPRRDIFLRRTISANCILRRATKPQRLRSEYAHRKRFT